VFNRGLGHTLACAMPEANTKPTRQSVTAYLDAIGDGARRDDCQALAALMQRVTGCAPKMWGTSIVGFSPRKGSMSICIVPGFDAAQPSPCSIDSASTRWARPARTSTSSLT
jgi:hypothetical protein